MLNKTNKLTIGGGKYEAPALTTVLLQIEGTLCGSNPTPYGEIGHAGTVVGTDEYGYDL